MSQSSGSNYTPVDVDELVDYLKSEPVRIAVFGEFSAGKTTVLNALIGEEILSVAVDPTTAVPTRVRYGREFNIFVERTDGHTLRLYEDDPPFWTRFVGRGDTLNTLRQQRATIQNFLKEWTQEGEQAGDVDRVTVEMPLKWLKNGIELVDTPGVNNEFTRHQRFTEQEAAMADVALLLMDARQGGGKRTEFEFMNDVQSMVSYCIVIPNKMDRLPVDEREEFLAYLRDEALPQYWAGPVVPEVMGISALAALASEEDDNADLRQSFDRLTKRVKEVARSDRGKLLLARRDQPVQRLFEEAKSLEAGDRVDRAHRLYYDLLDVLSAARMELKPAQDGISRCEKSLSAQVEKLDSLNARYSAALEIEETAPDDALSELKQVRRDRTDDTVLDEELRESISRLHGRITRRNNARRILQEGRNKIEQFVEDGERMKAADKAHDLLEYGDHAEFKGEKQNEVRSFLRSTITETGEWADGEWTTIRNRLEQHLSENQFVEAKDDLARLIELSSYTDGMDTDAGRAEETAALKRRVSNLAAAASAYEKKVRIALYEAKVLQNDAVSLSVGETLSNAIDAIIPEYEALYGPVELPENPSTDDERILCILTVEEKHTLARRLNILSEKSRSNGFESTVSYLFEREAQINDTDDKDLRQPHFYKRYPDSPYLNKSLEDDLNRNFIFALPSRVRNARERIDYLSNILSIDVNGIDNIQQINRIIINFITVSVLLLVSLSVIIGVVHYIDERESYISLDSMGTIEQSVVLSQLYHSSIFFSGQVERWMSKNDYIMYDLIISERLSYDKVTDYIRGNISYLLPKLYNQNNVGYTLSQLRLSTFDKNRIIGALVEDMKYDIVSNYFSNMTTRKNRMFFYGTLVRECMSTVSCYKARDVLYDNDPDLIPILDLVTLDAIISANRIRNILRYYDEDSYGLVLKYVESGNHEAVQSLLSNGADLYSNMQPPETNYATQPPLILAAARALDIEMIEILVENGANVNHRYYERGDTPLTVAIEARTLTSSTGALERLIELGADPNLVSGEGDAYFISDQNEYVSGRTPLRDAARYGDNYATMLLLENGAQPDRHALRIAEDHGHDFIAMRVESLIE